VLSRIIALLRPSPGAVRELALRETDPAHAHEFDPITLGPIGNGAILCGVALAAAVLVPLRLAMRLIRKA